MTSMSSDAEIAAMRCVIQALFDELGGGPLKGVKQNLQAEANKKIAHGRSVVNGEFEEAVGGYIKKLTGSK